MPITAGGGAGDYPVIIHPGQQRILFAIEDTNYGTPSSSAVKTFLEPCNSITTAIQRQPYEANEYAGVSATLFDMIETTHHSTVTISTPWRANGIGAWALAAIMGSSLNGASDQDATTYTGHTTVTGWTPLPSGAHQHFIVPGSLNNVCNTFTVWHDAGDGQYTSGQRGLLQLSACTVESIRFTFTPATALMVEVTLQGNFPKFRQVSGSSGVQNAPAAWTSLSGADLTYKATRMMGFQAIKPHFNIWSSSGSQVYPNQILSGDMTITRPIEVIESPYSQDPTYFLPGPLQVTGTLNMLFDGLGDLAGTAPVTAYGSTTVDTDSTTSTSVYQDYLNFKRTGTSTNPNQIRYVDKDGLGFEVTFYPIKWTSFGLTASAQSLQVNAGFTSFNDLAAAAPVSGASRISAIEHAYIVNNVPITTMIA